LARNGRELEAVPCGNNDWEAWNDLDEEWGRGGERLLAIMVIFSCGLYSTFMTRMGWVCRESAGPPVLP